MVALAARIRGQSIPTFTISIQDPALNERREADLVARHVGAEPVVVPCGRQEVLKTYPALIRAAEGPVIDTACAALLMLAHEVHAQGYKVALTGEGADEWLAGYPWYKVHRLVGLLDFIPGLKLSPLCRRAYLRLSGAPRFPWSLACRNQEAVGGPNAWLDIYGLMSMSKLRLFSPQMLELCLEDIPYEHLGLNLDRARRWHPLNRSLYIGARVMLPGLLLNAKGDRVAMNSPFDSFSLNNPPPFVDQLLSVESLRQTGYFDPEAVNHWRRAYEQMRAGSAQRISIEMGLAGVFSTQLWHQIFIDSSLADLPSLASSRYPSLAAS